MGAFCASTAPSASTGPVRVGQDGSQGGGPCVMSSWTAASSDCSRPMNNYVHVKTADLYRPNARLTPERQGYQVLTPFGKLGYSQVVDELNLSPNIRTAHPPRLPLPDHVHGLVALEALSTWPPAGRVTACPATADTGFPLKSSATRCGSIIALVHNSRSRSIIALHPRSEVP